MFLFSGPASARAQAALPTAAPPGTCDVVLSALYPFYMGEFLPSLQHRVPCPPWGKEKPCEAPLSSSHSNGHVTQAEEIPFIRFYSVALEEIGSLLFQFGSKL